MDVVDGDRELFEFIEDELLKMNDLNFELDL
jgi:hypothetical protein